MKPAKAEGKAIVSQELSPQLYDDVKARWEAFSASSINDTRAKHNLPKAGDLDVLNMMGICTSTTKTRTHR